METIVANSIANDSFTIYPSELVHDSSSLIVALFDENDLKFELGVWLSGIDSFLRNSDRLFSPKTSADTKDDWTREFRLTRAALLSCSKLCIRLIRSETESGSALDSIDSTDAGDWPEERSERHELAEFYLLLRDAILLSEKFVEGGNAGLGDWNAWRSTLADRLNSSPIATSLAMRSEFAGPDFLPDNLRKMLRNGTLSFSDQCDLQTILPRFGTILKWLNVIGSMIRRNEPLKPSILIFAKINEQLRDLIDHINNRLSRSPESVGEFFDALDAASYTSSIEFKRMFDHELSGILSIRSAPMVHARVETAYSLLNESIQQILAGFARLIDPNSLPSDIFPEFRIKLEQSLVLRQDLWNVMKFVQAAEANPSASILTNLRKELDAFLTHAHAFLFFKDKDTVERFCEEVALISEKKDIVPILHRFGAYLETLFGQVKLRTVLVNHPFESDA